MLFQLETSARSPPNKKKGAKLLPIFSKLLLPYSLWNPKKSSVGSQALVCVALEVAEGNDQGICQECVCPSSGAGRP